MPPRFSPSSNSTGWSLRLMATLRMRRSLKPDGGPDSVSLDMGFLDRTSLGEGGGRVKHCQRPDQTRLYR
jgi:hypothetical protein